MTTTAKTDPIRIAIARVVSYREIVSTHGYDLGRTPKTRTMRRAEAAMWINRGTSADLAKAEAYVAKENATRSPDDSAGPWKVFTFPVSEKDPLTAAKKAAMEADDRS